MAHVALVEPLIWSDVLDRPDLGVAHLVSSAESAGFPVQVITGQTHFLRRLFLDDGGAEIRELFQAARPAIDDVIGKHGVKRLEEWLSPDRLAEMYHHTVGSDRLVDFLDTHRVKRMDSLVADIFSVYRYHVRHLGNEDVSLIRETVDRIVAAAPAVIGFSAKYSFDVITRAIIRKARERLGVPVVLGGSRLVYLRGDDVRQVLEREGVDYVVIGPGETALVSLLEALRDGNPQPQIPNLFYLRDGQLVDNGMGVTTDLESLPTPDFSQFELDLYLSPVRILPLQYARGCSWRRCTFCAHHAIYLRTYHSFKRDRMQEIISELRSKHGVRHFALHDEELPPADCRRLSNSILDNGPDDVRFFMYGRAVDRFDRETFQTMYRAGFRAISWGLESMVQRVLDLMEKGTVVEEVERVLRDAREEGIANLCFLIFGFPGETPEEAKATVAALERIREHVDYLLPNYYLLDPSSPAAHEPAKFGLTLIEPEVERDPADMEYSYLPKFRVAEGMQQDEAERFCNEFNYRAMFNVINVTSDRFKFFPPGAHVSRMLLFLLESDGLTVGQELCRLIASEPAALRPLIIGRIETADGASRLRPMRYDETAMVNDFIEPQRVEIDVLLGRVLDLADGQRTVTEIAAQIGLETGRKPAEAESEVGTLLLALAEQHHCVLGLAGPRYGAIQPQVAAVATAGPVATAASVATAAKARPRRQTILATTFEQGRVKTTSPTPSR